MDDYLDMTGVSPSSVQIKLLHATVCDDILLAEGCIKAGADSCYIFEKLLDNQYNLFHDYAHFSAVDSITAFQEACGRQNIEMVKLMLKYGANPNMECIIDFEVYNGYVGPSPLHATVISLVHSFGRSDDTDLKKCEIVKLLLKAGADPHKHIEEDGRSLYDLVNECNPPVARVLKRLCLDIPLSTKEFIYENVLKRNIPKKCNMIKYKPGNMGAKIIVLRCKLVQSSTSIDDIDEDIKEYLGIYNDSHLYRIAEY